MFDLHKEPAPVSSYSMEVNPLTLAFRGQNEGLESVYLDDYYDRSIGQARGSLFLILFYYLFFGLLDSRLIPESAMGAVFYVRFGVVTPLIVVTLLLSYTRYFKRLMQPILAFVMFIGGAGIVVVLVVAPPPLNFAYYVGLILVFIHSYTFTKIRFFWATLAGWALVILYEIVTVWVVYTPAPILIGNNFLLICASVVGMITCYSMEYFERRNFLLNHLLRTEHEKVNQANRELEQKVEQRTREISRANEELNLKIEQNLRMMDELTESRDFSDSLIDSLQDGLAVYDSEGAHLDMNPAFCAITGYEREELLGLGVPHPYWAPEDKAMLSRIFSHNHSAQIHTVETSLVRKDRTRCQVLISPAPIKRGARGLSGFVVTFKDIQARKMAEQALAHSEARYRAILASMEELYFELDLKGRFTFVNDAVMRFSGYSREELLGLEHGWYDTSENGEQIHNVFSDIFATGKSSKVDSFQVLAKGGEIKYAEITAYLMRDKEGNPIGFKGLGRDMTEALAVAREKKVLESQLRQSQKMEAVGTLAGGIAHDFNNILSAIMAYTEAVLIESDDRQKTLARLSNVKKASLRAKDLIKQILTFSRNAEQEMHPVEIPFLTREALKLLRASLPSTIEIQYSAEPGMGRVMADPTQVHQVLMNLCGNAEHAMRKKGGILEVTLETVVFQEREALPHMNLNPGRYVHMMVADSGTGIDSVTQKRIFDPYFTTKEKGEGTGLGLAVVHGIVEACHGAITVESEEGKGSRFHVYLPETAAVEEAEEKSVGVTTGNEHILLVDDEPDLLDSFTAVLKHYGYEVTTSDSSIAALAMFKASPDTYDLVVTDQTMPGMTGVDLSKEILKVKPNTPIILCTGYSSDASSGKEIRDAGIRKMIMKPFAFEDFMQIVRNIMDHDQGHPSPPQGMSFFQDPSKDTTTDDSIREAHSEDTDPTLPTG